LRDIAPGGPENRDARGIIAKPGDERYETGRRAFNLMADQHPALVALPVDEHGVAFAIKSAVKAGMTVAPQRTGHGATTLGSLENTLLLRTDLMNGVEVDTLERRARVQAGSCWGDVVPAASDLGLAALHGSSPGVGIVGYTLSGGISWYVRRYGLASDHVRAIELVTADGQLRRLDHASEPELFWALRGGEVGSALSRRSNLTYFLPPSSMRARCSFPGSAAARSCMPGMLGRLACQMS
jgi:FAD/FMN-containing dehydrogenase